MQSLRHHIFGHRALAAWLVAIALAMKILVPAGFMPSVSGGVMTIALCTGEGAKTLVMNLPATPGEQDHHKKAEMPCAFSGLSAPSLAAVDPVLLAITLLFILATGFRHSAPPPIARGGYLRPPLRGPPALR